MPLVQEMGVQLTLSRKGVHRTILGVSTVWIPSGGSPWTSTEVSLAPLALCAGFRSDLTSSKGSHLHWLAGATLYCSPFGGGGGFTTDSVRYRQSSHSSRPWISLELACGPEFEIESTGCRLGIEAYYQHLVLPESPLAIGLRGTVSTLFLGVGDER